MKRAAAIDIGTNTVRLLVADLPDDASPVHVERRLEITRVGRGVDADHKLNPDAVRRTIEVVGSHAARARELGAGQVRVAATSALRDAEDREGFAGAVLDATGTPLEVLTGSDEGALAFLGATYELRGTAAQGFVVCDVGGGSTELVSGIAGADSICSLELGSVRLRERCLPSDPPASTELEEAWELVSERLSSSGVLRRADGTEQLVGVAGTVTTLAALTLGLDRYDPDRIHRSRIPRSVVVDWSDRLARMTVEEVRKLPAMEPGRADVIAAGALILRRVMEIGHFDEVVVSERDILDGLLLDVSGLRDRRPLG